MDGGTWQYVYDKADDTMLILGLLVNTTISVLQSGRRWKVMVMEIHVRKKIGLIVSWETTTASGKVNALWCHGISRFTLAAKEQNPIHNLIK